MKKLLALLLCLLISTTSFGSDLKHYSTINTYDEVLVNTKTSIVHISMGAPSVTMNLTELAAFTDSLRVYKTRFKKWKALAKANNIKKGFKRVGEQGTFYCIGKDTTWDKYIGDVRTLKYSFSVLNVREVSYTLLLSTEKLTDKYYSAAGAFLSIDSEKDFDKIIKALDVESIKDFIAKYKNKESKFNDLIK